MTAEDALRTQGFPHCGLIGRQRFECVACFVRQFGGVGVVDGQALGRAQVGFSRGSWRRCMACFGVLLYRAQTLDERSFRSGADYQCSA